MTSLAMDTVTTFALALNKSISRNEEFIDRCGVKDLTLNKSMDCKMSSELLDVVIMGKSVSHIRIIDQDMIFLCFMYRDQFLLTKTVSEL